MRGIIERFEEDCALLELDDRTTVEVDLEILPQEVHEGDVIDIAEDGTVTIDAEATAALRREVKELEAAVWEKDDE